MKWSLQFIVLSVFLLSCSPEVANDESKSKETPTKTKKKPVEKVIVDNSITNKNVESRLLEYGKENQESIVLLKTSKGEIKIRLYKDTPLHRANFLLMAKNDCFDSTVFTRVSENFMAQAGGTYDQKMVDRRNKIGRYTVPAEILPHYYHKAGSVGSGRSYNENIEKRSSPFAFYMVEGSVYNDLTLDKYEELNDYNFPKEHRKYYLTNRGAAHIDGEHTIFGEIIEGLDILPLMTNVKTDSRDWPMEDIYIYDVVIIE